MPPSNQHNIPALTPLSIAVAPCSAKQTIKSVRTPKGQQIGRIAAADVQDILAFDKGSQFTRCRGPSRQGRQIEQRQISWKSTRLKAL